MAELNPTSGQSIIPGAPATPGGSAPEQRTHIIKKTTAVVIADGSITVYLDPVPSSVEWLIERIGIHCTSQVQTDFAVYEDVISPQNRRDFTPVGNDDTADYAQPMWFAPGQQVILQWTDSGLLDAGGNPVVGSVNIQILQVG